MEKNKINFLVQTTDTSKWTAATKKGTINHDWKGRDGMACFCCTRKVSEKEAI